MIAPAISFWIANTSFNSRSYVSDHLCESSRASMSCAVILKRLPDCRTLPSRTQPTPSFAAISRTFAVVPLKVNADVRDVTRRPWSRLRALISSSVMPSEKYSLAGSALMFTNGSTAIAGVLIERC